MTGKPGGLRPSDSVFVDGSRYSVQRSERIRGRTYLLLELLAPTPRERWLAFDTTSGQPCSLLVLPNDDSTAHRIHVLRRVKSHSVPKILDFVRGKTQTRIVMPWIRGITVKEYVNRIQRGKVAPPEPFHAVRLVLQLARGLNALHRYGQIIHGDVKPANLILTHKPGHLHLIDFGSAWPASNTGFRADGDGTSGAFTAPELRTDGIVNERVDQFSAMIILYQLLTGVIPYEGLGGKAGWPEYADGSVDAVPPSQCQLSRTFLPRKHWREIDALVLRSIRLDPRQRFDHSYQWVDALEDVFLKLRIHRSASGLSRLSVWDRLTDFVVGRFVSLAPLGEKE